MIFGPLYEMQQFVAGLTKFQQDRSRWKEEERTAKIMADLAKGHLEEFRRALKAEERIRVMRKIVEETALRGSGHKRRWAVCSEILRQFDELDAATAKPREASR